MQEGDKITPQKTQTPKQKKKTQITKKSPIQSLLPYLQLKQEILSTRKLLGHFPWSTLYFIPKI